MTIHGKFITFEGSEGSGKSTQAALVLEYLKSKNNAGRAFARAGGSQDFRSYPQAFAGRRTIPAWGMSAKPLLYMAARAQMVKEVLEPQLKSGKIILCDRFLDSTIAYQGYGNGIDIKTIEQLGCFATKGLVS